MVSWPGCPTPANIMCVQVAIINSRDSSCLIRPSTSPPLQTTSIPVSDHPDADVTHTGLLTTCILNSPPNPSPHAPPNRTPDSPWQLPVHHRPRQQQIALLRHPVQVPTRHEGADLQRQARPPLQVIQHAAVSHLSGCCTVPPAGWACAWWWVVG